MLKNKPTPSTSESPYFTHIKTSKSSQLYSAIPQFFSSHSSNKSPHYIIHRWSFDFEEDPIANHSYLRVEIIDLLNGKTITRLWEMMGPLLLSDIEYAEKDCQKAFTIFYNFEDWQELTGERSDFMKNESLKLALDKALIESKLRYKKYVLS